MFSHREYELRVTRGFNDPLPVCQGNLEYVNGTLEYIEKNMRNNGWSIVHKNGETVAEKSGITKTYYKVEI